MRDKGNSDAPKADLDWLPPEERLRIATRAAGIGIWEWDLQTGQVEYTPTAREIVGFSPDEPITVDMVRSLIHPEDRLANEATAQRAFDPKIRDAPIFRFRLYRRTDGEERWLLCYVEVLFDDDGDRATPVRYVGTLQDITEQVHTEQQLKVSEERLRMAVEAGNLAVWEVDLVREEVTHSPALNRLCGFPEDARPTLEEFRSRYAPGERERMMKIAQEAMARGENKISAEIKHVWPDGTEKWLALQAMITARGDEGALHAVGVLADVTERRRHEIQLETAAREMRHRVKNQITVIGAIASHSLASGDDPAANRAEFLSRLRALAGATDLILEGPGRDLDLRKVIETAVQPFRDRPDTIVLDGPEARLPEESVRNLALAMHELCTNAVKYGALSTPSGRVTIAWDRSDGMLHLTWRESGGPPVTPPRAAGFGTRLLTTGLFASPEDLTLDFAPDGLLCRIVLAEA